jgi:UDP-3-O-[3-hydroxymyristoyl] N-acetylglucosamine deacetylase
MVKNHLVSVGKSKRIKVVEHLFSALYGLGLYYIKINFWGNELPFFDGSSLAFAKFLSKIKPKKYNKFSRINKKISIKDRDSFIQYEPFPKNGLIIEMELSHPFIKTQKITLNINKSNYIKEIAPARTFVFTNEDDPRLKKLPPYGIGVTKKRIYCATPLRFSDELVRHKVLDLLGDLYVLQKKLAGRITCKNTSHQLNLKFIRRLTVK